VESIGFVLKPNGFFAENPAMDLPPNRNHASKDQRDSPCCA
jgi:primary-amine oxidase